ncbi:hypothetical protein [Nonomuraea salmonea]|uniref:hypothetical protein n=1 Tax=Nonomuraea salmonea TaxID=46181 RepID=UPI002FE81A5F
MPFVELFVPKGSLDEESHEAIGGRLVSEVMLAEGAPDTEVARSISWLVVNEIDAWFVGGRRVPAGEQPRYVVRVGVPAGSMDDGKRRDIVRRVTRVLADADPPPGKVRRAHRRLGAHQRGPRGQLGSRRGGRPDRGHRRPGDRTLAAGAPRCPAGRLSGSRSSRKVFFRLSRQDCADGNHRPCYFHPI